MFGTLAGSGATSIYAAGALCGTTITTDLTFTGDIDCTGVGGTILTVGVDGITIDGGGATIPTGQTQFRFKAGDLNFHSNSYQWLVVAGVRAKFKGSGAITGEGDFAFMLTAVDGQVNGGGGVDKFRIKIWDNNNNDAVVYDNQMDESDDSDAATELSGCSIVIHAK